MYALGRNEASRPSRDVWISETAASSDRYQRFQLFMHARSPGAAHLTMGSPFWTLVQMDARADECGVGSAVAMQW